MNELTELIKKGQFQMEKEPWGEISHCAKDLIRKLIVLDPDSRLEPGTALLHSWFKGSAKAKQQHTVEMAYQNHLMQIFKMNLKSNKSKLVRKPESQPELDSPLIESDSKRFIRENSSESHSLQELPSSAGTGSFNQILRQLTRQENHRKPSFEPESMKMNINRTNSTVN